MRPIIQTPRLCPIKMVPVELPTDPRIHQYNYLSDWYSNLFLDGEDRQFYAQKWQMGDRIRLQFNISTDEYVYLQVLDCYGVVKQTIYPYAMYDLVNNTDRATGTHMYLHYFRFTFGQYNLPEGYYWLVLHAGEDGNDAEEISEPLHLAADHYGTILLQGRNDRNSKDCVFEQTNCIFNLRAEGAIGRPSPEFEYTGYKDQGNRRTKLSAEDGRSFELGFDQIPDWLHDKISSLIICDYLVIEDTRYALDDSSKWDTENTPLRSPSITIWEADPDAATTSYNAGTLTLATLPVAYPYAVQGLYMGINAPNIRLAQNTVIFNDAGRTAFIAALNAARTDLELDGTFQLTGQDLQYVNATNEYYTQVSVSILTNYTTYTFTGVPAGGVINLGARNANVVIAWGDGSTIAFGTGSQAVSVQHVYAASGTYTAYVFGLLGSLILGSPYLTAIGGSFVGLTFLSLVGTGLTTFNATVLGDSFDTLRTLEIRNGSLFSVTNFDSVNFFALNSVNFSANGLNSTQVSNIILAVDNYSSTNGVNPGGLSVNAQVPFGVSISYPASNAVSRLRSRGWTVNY